MLQIPPFLRGVRGDQQRNGHKPKNYKTVI